MSADLLSQLQQSFQTPSTTTTPLPTIPSPQSLPQHQPLPTTHESLGFLPLPLPQRLKNRVGDQSLSEASIVQLIQSNHVRQSEQLARRIRHEINQFIISQVESVIIKKVQSASPQAKTIEINPSDIPLPSEWKQVTFPAEFHLSPTAFQRLVRHLMNEILLSSSSSNKYNQRSLTIRTPLTLYTHLQTMTEYWITQLITKGKELQMIYERQTFTEKEIDGVKQTQLFTFH